MILTLIDRLAFSWLIFSCFLAEGAEFAAHFLVNYMKFLCRIDWCEDSVYSLACIPDGVLVESWARAGGRCDFHPVAPEQTCQWALIARSWKDLAVEHWNRLSELNQKRLPVDRIRTWSWFLLCSCLLLNIDEPWWAQLRWRLDSTTTPVSTPSLKLSSMRSRPMNSLCNQPQVWRTSRRILDDCSIQASISLHFLTFNLISLSTDMLWKK